MNIHKNARLTPLGRERIVRQVESGQTPEAISETAGVCPRTVRKWVEALSRREGSDHCSELHFSRRPASRRSASLAPPLRSDSALPSSAGGVAVRSPR